MKRIALALAALTLLAGLSSCRKDKLELVNPNAIYCKTFSQQFEMLWHGMDQSYLFWEYDTVDWDARYEKYKPIFQEFDSRRTAVSQTEYQQAIAGLFAGLTDHHLFVSAIAPKGNASAYYSPGSEEVGSRPGYHWTDRRLQVNALGRVKGVSDTAFWDGDEQTPATYFALIPANGDKKIAYFRFSDFSLYSMWLMRNKLLHGVSAQEPIHRFYGARYGEGISDFDGSYGWASSDQVSGIIFDVRGNGGGNVSDLTPFVASLFQESLLWGYSRIKEGIGRLDYSAWTEFWLRCPSKHLKSDKPIVVLADVNSVSCAEITTQAIKSLPNGTFIGERTYGATGPLTSISQEAFYSGSFGNLGEYGYYVYTSYMDMNTAEHQSLEGKGIVPDIEVPYDEYALRGGSDTQLNRAIEYIRTGK